MDKFKVGDKIFCVDYLRHLGNKYKWLKINLQPFSKVMGTYKRSDGVDLFSPFFSDIKEALQIPMHRNKIFYQTTGYEIERGSDRFLHTKKDSDEIKLLVHKSVSESVSGERKYYNDRIERLQREIVELVHEGESNVNFCLQCQDDILKGLED